MKKALFLLILLSFCANLTGNFLVAQKGELYTDYKPVYTKYKSEYIIDRISYTKSRMIIYFRYVCANYGTTVTFFGNQHEEKWVLLNRENMSEYVAHYEIKSIRKNGVVQEASLTSQNEISLTGLQNDVFTCEIHFPRPKYKSADLLEGINMRNEQNHFHALNIKIKPEDSPDLGKPKDMLENIARFERNLTGKILSNISAIPLPPRKNKPKDEEVVVVKPPVIVKPPIKEVVVIKPPVIVKPVIKKPLVVVAKPPKKECAAEII